MSCFWPPALITSSGPARFPNTGAPAKALWSSFGESPRKRLGRLPHPHKTSSSAADTVVCVDGEIFGKPSSDDDAARMLRCLSGRDHQVYTGICILSGARRIVDLSSTRVSFLELTEKEIQEYTRSGEPRDKAGAYAIQGLASKFVRSIEGCYHNVVGLPVSLVYSYLRAL